MDAVRPHPQGATANGGLAMGRTKIFLTCLLVSGAALAAKPGASPPDPKVAYVILTGPGFELRVTNEDGTNMSVLHKSPLALRFDLAPRARQQIAITDGNDLKLLDYAPTGTGALAATNVATLFTNSTRLYNLDVSPDGTKIAFPSGDGSELRVYDLSNGTHQVWTTAAYVWDVAWYKNGGAIAFIVPGSNGAPHHLYEITGPGAAPTLLHSERNLDMVDASRTDGDALVLSYNDAAGNALVGLWKAGGYVTPNLTNRSAAFKGSLNCSDTKLMYGAPGSNGQTVWYARDLTAGLDQLYTKTPRANWTQYWPTC